MIEHPVPAGLSLEACRAHILEVFPDLAAARFTLLTTGWDSLAVDVDDRLIFKFPRHAAAEQRLVTEASLLRIIRPSVNLAVPDMTIHAGPPLFSSHAKIPGEHLLTEHYRHLDPYAHSHLSGSLALFYSQIHALEPARMTAAGARPIHDWSTPDEVARRIEPLLPEPLKPFAHQTIDAWSRLGPDPLGTTFGYFDGHGWNMAFDHDSNRLDGLYDFADAGIGDVHREFVYSNWIARRLTEHIVTAYEIYTRRRLDRARIETLSGALRLWELSEAVDRPDTIPAHLDILARWAEG